MAALLLTFGSAPPVRAAGAAGPTGTAGAFQVGLIGDTGYSPGDEKNLLRVRQSANAAGLAFVVHDGDIQKGDTPCSDGRLQQVKGVFNGFTTLVYTPGDNEWQDCPSGPQGRLAAIRRIFFSTGSSLGTHPISQVRQPGVPENARWERGGVVFATLDVPGPDGGGPAAADGAWLDTTFDRAAAVKAAAVMIIWQDDPTDGSSGALVARLKRRAAAFGKPVVLVHGDTHQYKLDHPWKDTPNLTRLETYPGFTPQWVKATVDPASPGVFHFATLRG